MTNTLTQATVATDYWTWRGHRIYYVRSNTPSTLPPLLLVHGFGASTDHWKKNIAGLRDHCDVWAIDLLGFGRSSKPNIPYSGQLWRDQLHDFITEVIQKPVILAGNSLGGYASLCTAGTYPESVKGLILVNSAGPFTDTSHEKPPLWRQMIGQLMQSIFRQSWANYFLFQYMRNRKNIRKTLEKVYLNKDAVTDELVEDIYRPSCDQGAVQVFASVFSTPQGEKVDLLLKQLQCPLLMLWGKADPWMKVEERSTKFRQFYPQLTEYFLEAGHCPHDEIPEQVNQFILTWVSSVNP